VYTLTGFCKIFATLYHNLELSAFLIWKVHSYAYISSEV